MHHGGERCSVHRRLFDSDVTSTYLIAAGSARLVGSTSDHSRRVKTNQADRAI